MRRILLSFALALMLLVAPVFTVNADEWSDDDPVVLVKTPRGAIVTVYNTMGVYGVQHAPMIALAKVSYTVTPADGGRATLVRMSVTIPDDLLASSYPTRTVFSSGPWGTLKVYARVSGVSGAPMTAEFKLNVP